VRDFCWNEIGVWGDRSCPKLQEHSHCRDCATFSQEGRALLNREAPGNYLAEWVSLLAQEREAVSRDPKVVQVFRLMSEWFALPAHCWVEVVGVRPIRPIPHRSSQILLGLVSVRGEIHLCVSLSNLLGVEKDEGLEDAESRRASPRFCVVKRDNINWVFPVDEVHGLISYAEKDVGSIPSTLAKSVQKFTRGLLNVAGRKIGLLDETLVFDALSRSVL
jgi:chemotaxis-related protein WspD